MNLPDVYSAPQLQGIQGVSAENSALLSSRPTPVFSDTQYYPSGPATEVSPVLQELLTYQSLPENNSAKKKKRSLPNFMNSEVSQNHARRKIEKSKRTCRKGEENSRKEDKKEAKRKEQEENKRKKEEKNREKEKSASTKKTKKRKVSQRKGKQWRKDLLFEYNDISENNCKVCLTEYDEGNGENMPWVMCVESKYWMHVECIPFGVNTSQIHNGDKFFCHDCN